MRDALLAAGLALCRVAPAAAAAAAAPPVTATPTHDFTVDPTAPWVSVDDEGQPAATVTPSVVTRGGTSSVVDGAPAHLTASVFSWTRLGIVTTSTGTPPNPTATRPPSPEGVLSRCFNPAGPLAPFCRPLANSTLVTGDTYYVTWDPDFYDHPRDNVSYQVVVRLDYLNTTSNEMVKLDTYDRVPAKWGYWSFKLTPDHLMGQATNNVTVTLLASPEGSAEKNKSVALPVVLARPALPPPPSPHPLTRSAVLFALPLSLGVFVLILVGLCLWHYQTRRINVGSVMGRARRGYTGRRARRAFSPRDDKHRLVQLDAASPYRDGDALAGPDANHPAPRHGGNAFRNEMRRQAREREGSF